MHVLAISTVSDSDRFWAGLKKAYGRLPVGATWVLALASSDGTRAVNVIRHDSIGAVRGRTAGIGTFLIEALQGMCLVVTHNAQEREAARFRERNDAFIDSLMHMRRLTYLSGGQSSAGALANNK